MCIHACWRGVARCAYEPQPYWSCGAPAQVVSLHSSPPRTVLHSREQCIPYLHLTGHTTFCMADTPKGNILILEAMFSPCPTDPHCHLRRVPCHNHQQQYHPFLTHMPRTLGPSSTPAPPHSIQAPNIPQAARITSTTGITIAVTTLDNHLTTAHVSGWLVPIISTCNLGLPPTVHALHRSQPNIFFDLLATDTADATYTADPGVRRLGRVVLELPAGWAQCEEVRAEGSWAYTVQVGRRRAVGGGRRRT